MKLASTIETSNNSPLGVGGIAIIADDFTGAAELAGISLRYGLSVELSLVEVMPTNADVLIICTDSRSLNVEEAKTITATVIKNILKLEPNLIYKKIDSVLRGHIIEEVNVQMELSGFEKVLILPANPSLGRSVINGEYFIDEKIITDTGFASDPEFPVRSSWVKEMIRSDEVFVLEYTGDLPDKGIVIGNVGSARDIEQWLLRIDKNWMLVGAADFYTAILDKDYQAKNQPSPKLQTPHLYVCGTAFSVRKDHIKKLGKELDCVAWMPGIIDEGWLKHTCGIIRKKNKAVIAIDEPTTDAAALRVSMAKAVKTILERENINEIFIEGGSTAAAVLNELGIKKLSPVNELQRGVVRMKAFSFTSEVPRQSEGDERSSGVADLFITVKPGSYELPAEIKALYM